jgi:hypothetical protein
LVWRKLILLDISEAIVALVHASVVRDIFLVFFNITGCAGMKLFGTFGMKLLE